MESAHRYFRIGAPLILEWTHQSTGICTGSEKCYEKLNNIEKRLLESDIFFYRTHQSFLINPKFVSVYSYDSMELLDGTTLTVSENRRKKVNELFCALKGEDIIV